jgi:glutamine synthetase
VRLRVQGEGDELLRWLARRPGIASVRGAVCDLNGVLRGKRVPVAEARKLGGGLRMPLSVTGVDIWGADVADNPLVFAEGDADGICEPTGRGPLELGWLEPPGALVPLWMRREDGAAHGADPRRALAAVLERYAARGLVPVVATELEFYLIDAGGDAPAPPVSPVSRMRLAGDEILSLGELDHFEGFLAAMDAACAALGVPAEGAISETGPGQFEINLSHHADALRAADDALLFKQAVKGVARRQGMAASFMAKPYADRSGSGFHVHFSLLDAGGRNVFDDGGPGGTATLRHAVGGVLAAMRDSGLVFAPHLNSYRRLSPRSHAPTRACWGYETRHAAVRIPGGPPAARRLEHRVAGADANPYLVLAAVLGAALDGIEHEAEPPPPCGGEPDAAAEPLCADWGGAVELFAGSEAVARLFAPELREALVRMKRQEMRVFAERVSPFEYETYLEKV